MRGIRQWLTSATVLAGTTGALAQTPAAVTAPAPALPGGTVVSGAKPPKPAAPLSAGPVVEAAKAEKKPTAAAPQPAKAVAPLPLPAPEPAAAELPGLAVGKVVGRRRPGTPPDASPESAGGKAVGKAGPPVATVSVTAVGDFPAFPPPPEPAPVTTQDGQPAPAKDAPPKKAQPLTSPAAPEPKSDTPAIQDAMPTTPPVPTPLPGGPPFGIGSLPGGECCGPIGGHGPIGQEVYLRAGPSFPFGDGLLARNLEQGWTVQGGGRSQFFNPEGDAAWAVDIHIVYSYNRGKGEDIFTVENEPVTLRDLHRTSVGLGLGRDYFLAGPGFILDTWDVNFRFGWDLGGRWGTGHVDLNPFLEQNGYRRRHDVFAQTFFGLTNTMELPAGGWSLLVGTRVEANYTFSDLIPRDASFFDLHAMFMLGVRY